MEQKILSSVNKYQELDQWLESAEARKVFLVCDDSIQFQKKLLEHLEEMRKNGIEIVSFQDFCPNPLYESVVEGVDLFNSSGCSAIMAVGGGSAIDVAKCIKLYSNMDREKNYLMQEAHPDKIPFLAMPTTAGTGSESTRYAVIYYNGKKQSVTSYDCIPDAVLLDPDALESLPLYQRKSTMLDALCHAVESMWSVNSTAESKRYSCDAIIRIINNMDGYLAGTKEGNSQMLLAANTAGKAINITQTTAGHAMCYKITSLFGVSHGHAAALCDRILFGWMLSNTEKCLDPRGEKYLKDTLDDIGRALGAINAAEGARKFAELFDSLQLETPCANEQQLEELENSVNTDRLKNHPVRLDKEDIHSLYRQILR